MGGLDGLPHAAPLLSLLPLFSYRHVGGLYFCLHTIYFLLMAHGCYCIWLCYLNLGQKDLRKTRGRIWLYLIISSRWIMSIHLQLWPLSIGLSYIVIFMVLYWCPKHFENNMDLKMMTEHSSWQKSLVSGDSSGWEVPKRVPSLQRAPPPKEEAHWENASVLWGRSQPGSS